MVSNTINIFLHTLFLILYNNSKHTKLLYKMMRYGFSPVTQGPLNAFPALCNACWCELICGWMRAVIITKEVKKQHDERL